MASRAKPSLRDYLYNSWYCSGSYKSLLYAQGQREEVVMEQKLMQAVIGILVALMAWNFNTVNSLQLSVERMMYQHANQEDIQELKQTVQRLQWILQDDGMKK